MQKTGYLDFHTHVLPGVDDGSLDREMTMEMLQALYKEGVRTVLATSHSYPDQKGISAKEQRALTEEVNAMAKTIASDLEVLPGNELYYRESLIKELQNGEVLTLAATRYILVEFHPSEQFGRIREAISNLILHGYYPVIAHIERVDVLIENKKNVKQLVEMSCYMQVNTRSLEGGFFDKRTKAILSLMKENLIHFIGSDCHNIETRPPQMEQCVKKLYKKLPKEVVDKVLIQNKELFLQNKFL